MKKIVVNLILVLISSIVIAGNGKSVKVIEGRVMDDSGNPAVGAKVELVESHREVYTDFDGKFRFENVTNVNVPLKVNYISHQELRTIITAKTQENRGLELFLESN